MGDELKISEGQIRDIASLDISKSTINRQSEVKTSTFGRVFFNLFPNQKRTEEQQRNLINTAEKLHQWIETNSSILTPSQTLLATEAASKLALLASRLNIPQEKNSKLQNTLSKIDILLSQKFTNTSIHGSRDITEETLISKLKDAPTGSYTISLHPHNPNAVFIHFKDKKNISTVVLYPFQGKYYLVDVTKSTPSFKSQYRFEINSVETPYASIREFLNSKPKLFKTLIKPNPQPQPNVTVTSVRSPISQTPTPAPPPSFLPQSKQELTSLPYYHGNLSRSDAETLLKGTLPGSYLLRESSESGKLSLSYKNDSNSITHLLLTPDKQDRFNESIDKNLTQFLTNPLPFLASLPYYHGKLSRSDAEALLKGTLPGSYLLRESSESGKLSLSYKTLSNSIDHLLLTRLENGNYQTEDKKSTGSLKELIYNPKAFFYFSVDKKVR